LYFFLLGISHTGITELGFLIYVLHYRDVFESGQLGVIPVKVISIHSRPNTIIANLSPEH